MLPFLTRNHTGQESGLRACRSKSDLVLAGIIPEKRSHPEMDSQIDWPANVWMHVSVENNKYAFRADHLRQTHAQIKFLSVEPLIGPVGKLNLEGIYWVIVGGESGPCPLARRAATEDKGRRGARPMKPEWVAAIRDQCAASETAFFFKQWGGLNKKRAGRVLERRTWDDMPRRLELQSA